MKQCRYCMWGRGNGTADVSIRKFMHEFVLLLLINV